MRPILYNKESMNKLEVWKYFTVCNCKIVWTSFDHYKGNKFANEYCLYIETGPKNCAEHLTFEAWNQLVNILLMAFEITFMEINASYFDSLRIGPDGSIIHWSNLVHVMA